MPNNSQSVVQNYEVKRGSRSCSTTCGTPKLHTMWSKNKFAMVNAESCPSPTTMGISLTHLVSLSTIGNTLLTDPLSGRFVMNSIDHTENAQLGCQSATTNQQRQRLSPSTTGKPSTHSQMQRPHMTSPATKHIEAEKMKSCRYLSIHQMHNTSLKTKASKVYYQLE